MKKIFIPLLLLVAQIMLGQGILVVDQQSTNLIEGAASLQTDQPLGQSFTPIFSSISFVSLNLYNASFPSGSGGNIFVNLRSNSITGSVLSSTTPLFLPGDFSGVTNFFFTTSIDLVPGIMYYLQPVAEPGSDFIGWNDSDASYTQGSAIFQGNAAPGNNFWFQEGIVVVPEPSFDALVLIGSGFALWNRRKKLR
jgi:hypothetical protein